MQPHKRRFILYTPNDRFHPLGSKTANGLILFRKDEVLAIVDEAKAGRTSQDVLGYGGDIPIVKDVAEALNHEPDTLVVGVAPIGGAVKPEWIPDVKMALEAGLEVWSGLHHFLADNEQLMAFRDRIWDVRRPPNNLRIAAGTWQKRKSKVILTIGSDSNVGKMTTALTLQKQLQDLGLDSIFIGTGQTGMMISGRGVAVDAVVSDFVNGATEAEIDKVDGQAPLIIVEGQGAVTHIGYSGVTMGLLHGAMPDAYLLAHQPSRIVDDYDLPIPGLNEVIALHEALMHPFKPARVLGVNLYSKDMTLSESHTTCQSLQAETGLPVEDMVRAPDGSIAQKVLRELFPEINS